MQCGVLPIEQILELTNEAWWEMPVQTFQSAWMVCGYFSQEHFGQFNQNPVSEAEAANWFDPSQTLFGSALKATPQFCTQFQWQILTEKEWS